MKVPVLIDDLDEAVVQAFGRMPNMTFVVDKQGKIAYKADWMEASRISEILDELLAE
jgi:predicted Fe-Mo cluster-binding NifX family protein